MRRLLWALGASLWFVVVLYVTFRLTFPSDVVVERARYELSQATDGGMDIEIGKITPSGLSGMKARDVRLFTVAGEERTEILALDKARANVRLLSLLGDPKGSAALQFGKGGVDVKVATSKDEKGRIGLGSLAVKAANFPLNAIPPISGTKVSGQGDLDLDLDLQAPEGFAKADGLLRLSASNLVLEEGTGMAAMAPLPLTIDEIDLRIEISKGKADVMKGRIASSLVTADLSGDIGLADAVSRTRLNLEAVLTLGEGAQMFAGMLKAAEWADGRYHYEIGGTIERPRVNPKREKQRTRVTRPGRPEPEAAPAEPSPVPRASKETLDAARAARERARERRLGKAKTEPAAEPDEELADDTEELDGPEGEFADDPEAPEDTEEDTEPLE